MANKQPFYIIGAGLFGSVVAQELAQAGIPVQIFEQQSTVGGNCQSSIDLLTKIEYHKFGTHIFHTNSDELFNYVNQFANFLPFNHRVEAVVQGKHYPLPFNLETFSRFFNQQFTAETLKHFLERERIPHSAPTNLEEYALSQVGPRFFNAFIKGYTEKQWGKKCKELPYDILKRIPIYFDNNRTYFRRAKYIALPEQGMNYFFTQLLDHPLISLHLNSDLTPYDILRLPQVIYTGAVDKLFNNQFGALAWREVTFHKKYIPYSQEFTLPVYNYPDIQEAKTRTHIPRNLYPQRKYSTQQQLCIDEFSIMAKDSPSYPIRTPQEVTRYQQYKNLAKRYRNLHLGGRLASYAYIDMDQTIAQAINLAKTLQTR